MRCEFSISSAHYLTCQENEIFEFIRSIFHSEARRAPNFLGPREKSPLRTALQGGAGRGGRSFFFFFTPPRAPSGAPFLWFLGPRFRSPPRQLPGRRMPEIRISSAKLICNSGAPEQELEGHDPRCLPQSIEAVIIWTSPWAANRARHYTTSVVSRNALFSPGDSFSIRKCLLKLKAARRAKALWDIY